MNDPQNDDSKEPTYSIDAILPHDMARHAESAGVEKAEKDAFALLALAILAGAFVAFGAMFAAAVTVGFEQSAPVGLGKLVGGLAFSLAYVLALVGGAELFTTNNLMVMAWAGGHLPGYWLLRAWAIVFVGNFLGALATGAMLIAAGQHTESGGAVGASLLASAVRLENLTTMQALFLGILGNTLLCLGVWLTYSARTTTDRILALLPPVAAFYAMGLEHVVAVMFYLPCAQIIVAFADPGYWQMIDMRPPALEIASFARVLSAVTAGNLIGGGGLVAMIYWFVYLHPRRRQD